MPPPSSQTARQTATQTIEPAIQRDRRRQAVHALVHRHGHTHANHTQKGHRERRCNYADDIHLMMTFPPNTDVGNYTLKHAERLAGAHPHAQPHMRSHTKCFHSNQISPTYFLCATPPLPPTPQPLNQPDPPLAGCPLISFISLHGSSICGRIDVIMTEVAIVQAHVCLSSTFLCPTV